MLTTTEAGLAAENLIQVSLWVAVTPVLATSPGTHQEQGSIGSRARLPVRQ